MKKDKEERAKYSFKDKESVGIERTRGIGREKGTGKVR